MGKTEHEPLEDLGIGTVCLALALGIFARSYLSKVRLVGVFWVGVGVWVGMGGGVWVDPVYRHESVASIGWVQPPPPPQQVLPIPYTVVLLIMGLLIGVILTFGADVHVSAHPGAPGENIFVNSVSQWVNISPEAVLFAILPILIFEASALPLLNQCRSVDSIYMPCYFAPTNDPIPTIKPPTPTPTGFSANLFLFYKSLPAGLYICILYMRTCIYRHTHWH